VRILVATSSQRTRRNTAFDRRTRFVQNGKRECVQWRFVSAAAIRSRMFTATKAWVRRTLLKHVAAGSTIHADEATSSDSLHARYLTKRINRSVAYSHEGACTNQAESFFFAPSSVQRWERIIASLASILICMLMKWHGVKTTAALVTENNI